MKGRLYVFITTQIFCPSLSLDKSLWGRGVFYEPHKHIAKETIGCSMVDESKVWSTLHFFIEFGKLSKSALSCWAGWVMIRNRTSEERELFMVHWSISLCICGQVHTMGYDWQLVYEWRYFCIYTSCNLELLQGLYWVTACFIFICLLDTSWDPYSSKCYYSTSPPSSVGNGLWGGDEFLQTWLVVW